MDKTSNQEFQKRLSRAEELIGALENTPDEAVRTQVRDLIQTLLEIHGTGLERVLSVVYDSAVGGAAAIGVHMYLGGGKLLKQQHTPTALMGLAR
ncbi:MAG: hypothetical protein ACREIF_01895 [Chthoniobacterales bacterium]